MKMLAPLIFLSIAYCSYGETLHNARGFDYVDVKFVDWEISRVKISHDSGLGWVALEDLTEESRAYVESQLSYVGLVNKADADRKRDAAEQLEAANKKRAAEAVNLKLREMESEKEKQRKEELHKKSVAELEKLSKQEVLWVNDFQSFEKFIEVEKTFPGTYMTDHLPSPASTTVYVANYFGKPDREQVQEVTTRDALFNRVNGQQKIIHYIYDTRLTNPTTGKKETLTIEFVGLFYRRAFASSGNESR